MQRFFLAVFVTLAVIASTYGETTCESHRRNSRPSGHGLSWNIQCSSEGHYEPPLQCTNDTETKKWCTCYNDDQAVKGPSKKLRHCDCPLASHEATQRGDDTCKIPQCERSGKFTPKQCCQSTRKCHCVDTNTGERKTEPSSDPNLHC